MKPSMDFILNITGYFKGHWESPDWGRLPVDQILIALVIRDFASAIEDTELRKQLHTAADQVVALNSRAMGRQ